MAVVAEIAALKFKFEVHALPALGRDLAFRLAIGKEDPNADMALLRRASAWAPASY